MTRKGDENVNAGLVLAWCSLALRRSQGKKDGVDGEEVKKSKMAPVRVLVLPGTQTGSGHAPLLFPSIPLSGGHHLSKCNSGIPC